MCVCECGGGLVLRIIIIMCVCINITSLFSPSLQIFSGDGSTTRNSPGQCSGHSLSGQHLLSLLVQIPLTGE